MNLSKKCVSQALKLYCRCRNYTQKQVVAKNQNAEKSDLLRIRNIGILAHIDAGKTTTTERMLFYSGQTKHMGEVHHGNTVTDFMEQERLRGITITSASVTFNWAKHNINLLDTPGHIDFTVEVEHTLNVMDGAVIILDGAAGVEAQTITVWNQADKYKIPRIIYVNKMDKPGAGFFRSVSSIQKNFHTIPVVLQLPIVKDSKFQGIVDLLSLEKCEWNAHSLGATYSQKALSSEDGNLWEDAIKARIRLTEVLADLDDKIAEAIIIDGKKLESVPGDTLKKSIRKITLEQKGVPVLCGSSYKNIGVQLLMNAIIDYLPSPLCNQSSSIMQCFGNELCARAFKVRHDSFKGPITFFRIYSGNLIKGKKIYNVKQEKSEQCGRLYVAYADDYEERTEIKAGNIAAVTGLKYTATGDLVTSSQSAYHSVQKAMKGSKNTLLSGAFVPDPVFFCSVEAPSALEQAALDKALSELQREDPSFRVTVDNETGQTVLGGMGELHLEVIRERIRSEYKIDANLGPLQIVYKEALIADTKGSHSLQHKIGNTLQTVNLTMSVLTTDGEESGKLLLDKSPECAENISAIFPKHLLAVKSGIENALAYGPKVHGAVMNANVMLHLLEVGRGTSESMITSAASQCVKKLLKLGGTKLLEPIMLVEVVCSENVIEAVINDLGRRRAELDSTESRAYDVVIRAFVPLSELLGYARELRILSSGSANFTMEYHTLKEMNSEEEAKAIKMSCPTTLKLPNGAEMPILGFGTWQALDEELEAAVDCALETGYRHIDTAYVYKNEHVVGRVVKKWLDSGKVEREDLFIVTKLPNIGNRAADVERFLDLSLSKLQVDYVDLYLIHTPFGLNYQDDETTFPMKPDKTADLDFSTDLIALWKKMEEMVDKGKAKAIGVSNFNIEQIKRILKIARIRPANNQVELHVYHQQKELEEFLKKEKITLTAYSSLGTAGSSIFMEAMGVKRELPNLLVNPVVKQIAEEVNKTTAQVLLRFVIQRGIATIPKSIKPERIRQNFNIFDFQLSSDQMSRLFALDQKCRILRMEEIFVGLEKHPEYPFKGT